MHRHLILAGLCACGGDAAACPVLPDAAPPPDSAPADPACDGEACGGDLVGTWEIVATCAAGAGNAGIVNCPEGDFYPGAYEVRGTWVIGDDGTIDFTGTETGDVRLVVPLSCFGLLDCAQLEVVAEAANDGVDVACSDLGPLDEACEVIPESCDCTAHADELEVDLSPTYTADAATGELTIVLGDETITGEYCATADALWIHYTRFGGAEYRYRFTRVEA